MWWFFWAALIYMLSLIQGSARRLSPAAALALLAHRRSSGRVTYSLQQRRVPPLLSHPQIKFITNAFLVAATVAAPTDTLAAAAVATAAVVVATVEVAMAVVVVVVVVVTGWVNLALVSRPNNGVWYHD